MSKRAAKAKVTPGGGRFWRVVRAIWRAVLTGAAWTTAVILLPSLLIGMTVRDETVGNETGWCAMIFYATPSSMLAIGCAAAAWHWRGQRRVKWTAAFAAVAFAAAWVGTDVRFRVQPEGKGDFRVAYWNCARPGWRLRGILPMAASWQADVLGFGESRPQGPLSPQWAEAFPGKKLQVLSREMLLIGPPDMKAESEDTLGNAGGFQLSKTVLGGREVYILMVDVNVWPLKTRRIAFERLIQVVDAFSTKPLVVMGDFNTPPESIYFQRLRARLDDAFDTAGSGLAATWPMPVPVLALDHILVNKHLRVVRCEHRTSIFSDHRAVVAEIAWR